MSLRGLDVDGILDHAIDLDDGATPEVTASRAVLGAVARPPTRVGERWIAADEARATLTPTDLLDGDTFEFVRDAVQALLAPDGPTEDREDAEHDDETVDPIHLVSAHMRALGPGTPERTILTMPDNLSQEGQTRWLQALRAAAPGRPELLWRPVAAILGWASQLGDEEAGALDGTEIVHVHLGAYVVEVSTLDLRVEWSGPDPIVVPRRHGPGQVAARGDFLGDPIATLMKRDRDVHDLDDASLHALMTQERPWRALFGEAPLAERADGPQPALVPTANGALRRVEGPTGVPCLDVDAAIVEIGRTWNARASGTDPIVLIDGVVGHVADDAGPIAERLARYLEARGARSHRLGTTIAAEGAARYGWRLEHDLPTYEDVLPSLRIFAKVEGEMAWIDLVPEGEVVPGGKEYAPDPVPGFRVAGGTEELNYAIARGDARHVRLTRTHVPTPPATTVDVDLIVRQRPGQGFASVQVKAAADVQDFEAGVYLDWATMERTEETPESYLAAQRANARHAYPAAAPHGSSSRLWRSREVRRTIDRVLHFEPHAFETQLRLDELKGLLYRKLESDGSVDSTRRMVDAHGNVPSGATMRSKTVQEIYDDLRAKIGTLVEQTRDPGPSGRNGTDDFRAALLTGSFMYAGAPDPIKEYARAVLGGSRRLTRVEEASKRYAWNVAGRCFDDLEDLQLLFAAAVRAFERNGELKNQQMRAVQEAFLYRQHAHRALDSQGAHTLARAAVEMLRGEVREANLASRFRNASKLLLGILRYRITDSSFLVEGATPPSDPSPPRASRKADRDAPTRVRVGSNPPARAEAPNLLHDAISILEEAREIADRSRRDDVAGFAEALRQYLEGEGTDVLLFAKWMEDD